jgi:hypothetical protein
MNTSHKGAAHFDMEIARLEGVKGTLVVQCRRKQGDSWAYKVGSGMGGGSEEEGRGGGRRDLDVLEYVCLFVCEVFVHVVGVGVEFSRSGG